MVGLKWLFRKEKTHYSWDAYQGELQAKHRHIQQLLSKHVYPIGPTMNYLDAIRSGKPFKPSSWVQDSDWLSVHTGWLTYMNGNQTTLSVSQILGDFIIKEKEVTITKTKLWDALSNSMRHEAMFPKNFLPDTSTIHVPTLARALGLED